MYCTVPHRLSVVHFVYSMEPSHGCGPFRTYSYMYYAITTTVDTWPQAARSIYSLVVSPAVTGPIIIFLW